MNLPLPFLKKKKEAKKVYIPVDLVLNYASQGLSEAEIASRLKGQGFEQGHVDRALRIALKEKITADQSRKKIPGTTVPATAPGEDYHMATPLGLEPPQPMFSESQPAPQVTRRPAPAQQPMGVPPERIAPLHEPRQMSPEQARKTTFTFEDRGGESFDYDPGEITIEELIEGIIDERWREFEDRLIDFEKRDIQLQGEIEDVRKGIRKFSGSLDQRERSLGSKLDEFGNSVDNIEGRIGSIEKVFKDFLPELTENIKSMSDLVEKIKEEKK